MGVSRFQLSDSRAGAAGAPPPSGSHHGPTAGHLPPKQENLEVVGSLEPTGQFGEILEGQIADLAVHKGYAYLNSWDNPDCERGGTYVVDIRNPSAPREAGFIPAKQPYYHGEGAHVVSINTPSFQGDLLAVNDETYGSNLVAGPCAPSDKSGGGFDLYDVTNPEAPVTLVQGAGDPHDIDDDDDPTTPPVQVGNSYHSVFVWQNGPRAFLVASDNTEFTDVDIFDITDPRAPVQVGDHDLVALFPQILDNEQSNGGAVFHHDMVVKNIGGRPVLMSDYWDAGYVQMDVSDPANPTLIGDTTFAAEDPLFPGSGLTPEGNGHQGEFSFDNQFLVGADEDFSTFRLSSTITSGAHSGDAMNSALSDAEPIPGGEEVTGDTVFVGFACTGTVDPPPVGVTIALAERGVCAGGFQEKIDAIEAAGYEMAVIFNNDSGTPGRCETLINMLVDPDTVDIPAAFIGRADAFRVLETFDESTYQCTGAAAPTPGDTASPPVGTAGSTVRFAADFDGWGYAHLFDAATSDELDAFAIPEAVDSRFAANFGDLSIHEVATDPTENLAYSSYYAGGMRVLRFDRASGLNQVGAFVDPQGSNFWGVEQFTTPEGDRLIAGSDRDFGLQLFRYTGPGAAQKPVCSNETVLVPFKDPADVPLPCSDANGNPLKQTRLSDPAGGTIADRTGGGWTYTHTGNRIGPAGSFTFKVNDGAADSNTATASLVAVPDNGGRCANRFVGSSARDRIVGSRFGDRISGSHGHDSISAGAGADCVSGNRGRDRLAGEGGVDRLTGHSGNDSLFGGSGRDRLAGGPGADRLSGGSGPDQVFAGSGSNRVSGGSGNDRIGARNNRVDRISCGTGRDRVTADANDRVSRSCERVNRG